MSQVEQLKSFQISRFSMYEEKYDFFVRSIGHCHLAPNKRQREKTVDFGEIFWCTEGRGLFQDALGNKHILRPGHVWYYPPGSRHIYYPDFCGFTYRWMTISGKNAANLFSSLKIAPGSHFVGSCPEMLFDEIYHDISHPNTQLTVLNIAFSILIKIAKGNKESSRTEGNITAETIREMIDQKFSDEEFSIAVVAERLGVHRATVSRCFKSTYAVDPTSYLISCRRQEALKLINTTNLPISVIAQKSGFSCSNYCIRSIKKLTGSTPGELRKINHITTKL